MSYRHRLEIPEAPDAFVLVAYGPEKAASKDLYPAMRPVVIRLEDGDGGFAFVEVEPETVDRLAAFFAMCSARIEIEKAHEVVEEET